MREIPEFVDIATSPLADEGPLQDEFARVGIGTISQTLSLKDGGDVLDHGHGTAQHDLLWRRRTDQR